MKKKLIRYLTHQATTPVVHFGSTPRISLPRSSAPHRCATWSTTRSSWCMAASQGRTHEFGGRAWTIRLAARVWGFGVLKCWVLVLVVCLGFGFGNVLGLGYCFFFFGGGGWSVGFGVWVWFWVCFWFLFWFWVLVLVWDVVWFWFWALVLVCYLIQISLWSFAVVCLPFRNLTTELGAKSFLFLDICDSCDWRQPPPHKEPLLLRA